MKTLSEMTKDERSQLLFLETCAVDHGGLVDSRHMNTSDFSLTEQWSKDGFISFGRITFSDMEKYSKHSYKASHWVSFSDEAWNLAHQERKNRSKRMFENRSWTKTDE